MDVSLLNVFLSFLFCFVFVLLGIFALIFLHKLKQSVCMETIFNMIKRMNQIALRFYPEQRKRKNNEIFSDKCLYHVFFILCNYFVKITCLQGNDIVISLIVVSLTKLDNSHMLRWLRWKLDLCSLSTQSHRKYRKNIECWHDGMSLGSIAVQMPAKLRSDRTTLNPCLAASRFCEIWKYNVLLLSE